MDSLDLLSELSARVREAGALAQRMRSEGIQRDRKADGSIVTSADRALETQLRLDFEKLVPGSTVWGEEFGYDAPGDRGWWLVDPIDGTSNFAAGSPLWGVSVAFMRGGKVEFGAVDLPDLRESYSAHVGRGAWLNGKALEPIEAGEIDRQDLVGYCEAVTREISRDRLPGKQRCAGAFVIEGAFVASKRLRAMIGLREKLYDMAASTLLCMELGADVRFADGSPFSFEEHSFDRKIDRPWVIVPRGCSWVS